MDFGRYSSNGAGTHHASDSRATAHEKEGSDDQSGRDFKVQRAILRLVLSVVPGRLHVDASPGTTTGTTFIKEESRFHEERVYPLKKCNAFNK